MSRQSANAPAGAGLMLLSAIVLGTAIGIGLGALVGAVSILAVLGGFVGLVAGFALVYQRFKNI
jgi:hypothetical protein